MAALDKQAFIMQYSFLNLLFQCPWYGEVVSLHRWLLRQGPLYNCTSITQDVIELCENAVVYIYTTIMHGVHGRVKI